MLKRLLPLLCLLPLTAQPQDAPEPDPEEATWKGQGALGFTSTSGNSDSQNLNAGLQFSRERLLWKHSLTIELVQAEADNEKSADRKALRERSEYKLSDRSYAFGQLRYEDDKFSGYDYQATLAAGAGSRFVETEIQTLDISLGVGYRNAKVSDSGDTERGPIVTSDLKYVYNFSAGASIIETALVESGEDNTYTQSETALLTKINDSLSSKISYLVTHNSQVPPDTEKTDTIFSVSLVYDF